MTIATEASALPTWDMSVFYPSVDSPEYAASVVELQEGLASIASLLDDAEALDEQAGPAVESLFERLAAHLESTAAIALRNQSFLYGHTAVDSRDRAAQAKMSELFIVLAELSKLMTRFTAWLGTLDVDALIAASSTAAMHTYQLRLAQIEARHQMEPAQEDLAAEITLSGGVAWEQLYDDLSSQIMVPFANTEGEVEELPMTEIRNLAMHADRDVRRRAWEAELAAWKQWETPIAAALNGVKGEHTTLARRRGWDSILDQALHQTHIDRATLDTMLGAARNAFPEFRRYFRAKARALGVEHLAWYDLFAPLPGESREWSWDDGVAFLNEQFGA